MTKRELRSYLRKWENGTLSKQAIEAELGIYSAKGKYITRLWQSELGLDTRNGEVSQVA